MDVNVGAVQPEVNDTSVDEQIIRVKDLTFAWSNRQPPILQIDDLHIMRGERVFLHGPSGSGKTTLLSLLSGVVSPRGGEITMFGERLDRMSRARRDQFRADHIGFIFQMFNLIPYLSVIDNVLLPCRFSARRREHVTASSQTGNLIEEGQRVLSQLGLEQTLFDRKATALSVGQQQRVAAARALFGAPPLLIADEPTSALDADTRKAFIELLFSQCRETETTLLLVSHDISLAPLFDAQVSMNEINKTRAS